MGWADPGLFQTAVITNLTYEAIVFYSAGDLSEDWTDKSRWSPVSTFITPPKPGEGVSGGEMRFLAFGDMGTWRQVTPCTRATLHEWC